MSIFNWLFPKLKEEDRMILEQCISDYNTAIRCLDTQYTTFKGRQELKNLLSPIVDKMQSIRIPRKDSLRAIIQNLILQYKKIDSLIDSTNKTFLLNEEHRCEDLLRDIDGKSLDAQQRRVVLCDEDRNLVLAGAGAGKTLTIAGKVKYLCEQKGVSPDEILLIAFTKKSAEEMTTRISDKLGIPICATTFHKLGLDIISKANGKRPDVLDDLTEFVHRYFDEIVSNSPSTLKYLLEYFAYYLNIPAEMENFDSLGDAYDYEKSAELETIRSKYEQKKYISANEEEKKTGKKTLQNERVKSLEEVSIANFLFLHGVRYEYERLYPYESEDPMRKAYRPDFYLPDYDLYLEHFGINRQEELPWLSPIEAEKYKADMIWKRRFHRQHGTKLIETYSYYTSEGRLLEELDALLKKNGVQYHEPDFADLFDTMYAQKSDKYFSEFIQLCCTFITLFKSNGYTIADLKNLQSKDPKYNRLYYISRTNTFKKIITPILLEYNKHLEENHAIDFSDMINKAAELVISGHQINNYKWVIIDEYQDISVARYNLVKAILNRTGAKLLCVGDDWQSIYRFTGSDLTLFTNFEEYFGKAELLRIEKTYRNSQQLIDVAGTFVMNNPAQFKKQLHSEKSTDYPIVFLGYTDNPFKALTTAIDKIIKTNGAESSILLLGRTNYDIEMVSESGAFKVSKNGTVTYMQSPTTPISFMSVHKAKGLEADNVILLNFQNSTLGFPNKISDDPILELVLTSADHFEFAEERRLLYVALTRTRNRIYILVNQQSPSEFLKEFKHSKTVCFHSINNVEKQNELSCPRCKTGHLMIRRSEEYNRYFVGCSNFPKCSYTISDTSVMNSPEKCPMCGGFLIKHKGRYGFFKGCTNYPYCTYTRESSSKRKPTNEYGSYGTPKRWGE